MMMKYRVSEVAKDFEVPGKEDYCRAGRIYRHTEKEHDGA